MAEHRKKGGELRFLAMTAAILLAGVLSAGLAAWRVVAPRAGILTEQVTPAIPTVLGQAAEEVLFPPWQWYELLPHERAAEKYHGLARSDYLVQCFRSLGAQLDPNAAGTLELAMELTDGQDGQSPYCLYLRNYPCMLKDDTSVLLQFASTESEFSSFGGNRSFSLLLRPADSQPQTAAQQAEALETVKQDLGRYLILGEEVDYAPLLAGLVSRGYFEEYYFYSQGGPELPARQQQALTDEMEREIGATEDALLGRIDTLYGADIPLLSRDLVSDTVRSLGRVIALGRDLAAAIAPQGDPALLAVEDFIEAQNEYDTYTIQIITTPRQIVLLLGYADSITGIYYDIQLEQYSGIGIYWP